MPYIDTIRGNPLIIADEVGGAAFIKGSLNYDDNAVKPSCGDVISRGRAELA